MAFSPFLTLSVVTEPLYTTMRSPLECVETHRLVISRFCQLLDRVEFFSHKFGVVQAHRTSSNPLKTHDIREEGV